MYETIDGIPCDGNGRMWEREAAEAAMNESTVITEDRVEALTKRIAELEKKLFAIGHAASCISGDSLEVIPILKGALAKESASVLERDARIMELKVALRGLMKTVPARPQDPSWILEAWNNACKALEAK